MPFNLYLVVPFLVLCFSVKKKETIVSYNTSSCVNCEKVLYEVLAMAKQKDASSITVVMPAIRKIERAKVLTDLGLNESKILIIFDNKRLEEEAEYCHLNNEAAIIRFRSADENKTDTCIYLKGTVNMTSIEYYLDHY